MVAEKRIYSTTALQNCYRALRSARWSVRRKDEHMARCCEVRELYAKCQVNFSATFRLLFLLSLIRTDGQVKESLKSKKMIFCGRTTKEQQKGNKKEPPHHSRSS